MTTRGGTTTSEVDPTQRQRQLNQRENIGSLPLQIANDILNEKKNLLLTRKHYCAPEGHCTLNPVSPSQGV